MKEFEPPKIEYEALDADCLQRHMTPAKVDDDGEARGILLVACQRSLVPYAHQVMTNRYEVSGENCLQEAFRLALEKFAQFRGETVRELRAWFRKILYNVVINRFPPDIPSSYEPPMPPQAGPASTAANKELWQKALRLLDADEGRLVKLRVVDELTFPEIAQKLGYAHEHRAKYVYIRALQSLRELLDDLGGEE
jgi:RNA polymerase sigma factor (sigma-70 family)